MSKGSHIRTPWILAIAACVFACLVAPTSADTRLDPRVAPTFQSVELDIDAGSSEYTGKVTIELEVSSPTDNFLFHAEEMELDRVELSNAGGVFDVTVEEVEDHGLRRATAARELAKGTYTLTIEFHKPFNTQALGLYRMEFEGKGYLFTQFEAIDARKAFPCWDEPNYKFPYQLTLTVPLVHEVITNTPMKKTIMGADTKTLVFAKTPPMPSYLLAIAAGPLESIVIPGLKVPGRVYTCKGQKKMGKYAASVTAEILTALEGYFGRPYPDKKLDLIAIPEYWPGAMENPGAVTYRDNILLIDSESASVAQKRLLCRVTAHELAHMWFGDLVTMAWWDDLWLNESFADWLGDKITDQLYPEFEWGTAALRDVQNTMQRDARPSTTAIRKEVNSPADMMEDLGLAYEKGKTVLKMVEVWIGEDHFQDGVRHYINKHEWGSTHASDLFDALSSASGKDLEPILGSYLDQPGYPLVKVDVGERGVIKLSQERFLNHGVEADAQAWTVPVHVKYSDGEETHVRSVLLDKESKQIEVGTNVDWVMPDAGAHGYYRWIVPSDMLFRIAENPTETLDARERAAFLGNAKALLVAGAIGGDDYLTVLSEFASDPDPTTINKLADDLGSVEAAFVTDDLRDPFAQYVRETLGPVLDHIGIEPRESEPETASMLRPRLLAWLGDTGQDAAVRDHCKKLAAQYIDDTSAIDPSLAGAALRVAMIDGTVEDFETCRKMAENTKVPTERSRFLRALGAFGDPALQDEALKYVLTGEVRPTETFTVVGGISQTDEGSAKVFQWMMDNYELITGRIPEAYAAYMPYFVSGCSEERLAVARKFFADPKHSVDGTEANLNKVSDSVMDCVNLREREGARVADYLGKMAAR